MGACGENNIFLRRMQMKRSSCLFSLLCKFAHCNFFGPINFNREKQGALVFTKSFEEWWKTYCRLQIYFSLSCIARIMYLKNKNIIECVLVLQQPSEDINYSQLAGRHQPEFGHLSSLIIGGIKWIIDLRVASVRQHSLLSKGWFRSIFISINSIAKIQMFRLWHNQNLQTYYSPIPPPGIKDTVSQEVKSVRFFLPVQLPPDLQRMSYTGKIRFLYCLLNSSFDRSGNSSLCKESLDLLGVEFYH